MSTSVQYFYAQYIGVTKVLIKRNSFFSEKGREERRDKRGWGTQVMGGRGAGSQFFKVGGEVTLYILKKPYTVLCLHVMYKGHEKL